MNAPTQDVAVVGGREPEAFEDIVRRYIAAQPNLQPSAGRRLAAVLEFLKILAMPALDLAKVQSDRDYVQSTQPRFSQDSDEWAQTHVPKATAETRLNSA